MRSTAGFVTVLALGASLAGCGSGAAPMDEDLARDLQQISGSSLELAPAGQGTQVMSAIEQTPRAPAAAPAPAPTRAKVAQNAPRPRQQQTRTASPSRRAVQQAPAPAESPDLPEPSPAPAAEAPRPTNPPLGAGDPPPGGWRNVNDVIRNSRVPITP